jgi:hypothetical protein
MSRDTVRKAYLDIGQQLMVPGLDDEKADVFRLVQRHLNLESSGRWLFVLDNADDFDMLLQGEPPMSLLECLPRSAKGSVLITTRSRKVAVRMAGADVITVNDMT